MKKILIYNLIVSLFITATVAVLSGTKVYARDNCETHYGGGETCLINKRFRIEKSVRIQDNDDENDWKDKVTGVEEDDVIEFRIKIKNLSDEEADFDFDNMKMKDSLPDELERIGGDGLTEYWDDFAPGEERTFKTEVKIDKDEFDRDEDFEKCVVNKAEVFWDGEFEGADTATVCYEDEDDDDDEPKELPKTGSEAYAALAGLGLIASGLTLRKHNR